MLNLFMVFGLIGTLTWPLGYSASINSAIIASTHTPNYSNLFQNDDSDEWKKSERLRQVSEIELPMTEIESGMNSINIMKRRRRRKRNIPVLEPVRHLLNHVRDGHLNHTIHHNHDNHYHHLLKETTDANMKRSMMNHLNGNGNGREHENETSTAIETEMEREMINESNDLRFLEFLGSIGSKLFEFITNLRHVFAASSAPLLAASSSGSSGSL